MGDAASLLRRWPRKGSEGSTPSLSAMKHGKMLRTHHWWRTCCRWCPSKPGDVERRKAKRRERQAWKKDVRGL